MMDDKTLNLWRQIESGRRTARAAAANGPNVRTNARVFSRLRGA